MCVTFFNYDDDTSHSILWIFRNISFWSDAAIQQVHNQKTQACFAAYVKHCLNGTPILIHCLALGFGDGTWDSLFKFFLLIWTLVGCSILGWALSVSQRQLQCYSLLLSTATVAVYRWLWLTDWSFTQHVLNVTKVGTALLNCCVTWLVPHWTAAISVQVLCTLYNHAPVYSVTLFKATYTECICV